ncbi:MAG: hypothetical protein ACYC0V_22200, partial [Armatimonadota bacterium]
EVNADPKAWCVYQYDRPDAHDGIVTAFRRHNAPSSEYVCRLYGIDPDANYRVTFSYGWKPDAPVIVKGTYLANLKVHLVDQPGSVIVEYKVVD